jgi:hypothetical protein
VARVPGLTPGSGRPKKRRNARDDEAEREGPAKERDDEAEYPDYDYDKDPNDAFGDYGSRGKVRPKQPGKPTSVKAQPGPGAPTGGTGKDADGGKERTLFEDERRRQNEGGKDRPPVYRPTPTGRIAAAKTKGLPVIDKRTVKQKLADASRRKS